MTSADEITKAHELLQPWSYLPDFGRLKDVVAAALLAECEAGIEDAAKLVPTVNVCRTCKTPFFDPPGHYDEDCPKGRASWEYPTRTDIAQALRDLINTKEERE